MSKYPHVVNVLFSRDGELELRLDVYENFDNPFPLLLARSLPKLGQVKGLADPGHP